MAALRQVSDAAPGLRVRAESPPTESDSVQVVRPPPRPGPGALALPASESLRRNPTGGGRRDGAATMAAGVPVTAAACPGRGRRSAVDGKPEVRRSPADRQCRPPPWPGILASQALMTLPLAGHLSGRGLYP